jgi:hypothetical protein
MCHGCATQRTQCARGRSLPVEAYLTSLHLVKCSAARALITVGGGAGRVSGRRLLFALPIACQLHFPSPVIAAQVRCVNAPTGRQRQAGTRATVDGFARKNGERNPRSGDYIAHQDRIGRGEDGAEYHCQYSGERHEQVPRGGHAQEREHHDGARTPALKCGLITLTVSAQFARQWCHNHSSV